MIELLYFVEVRRVVLLLFLVYLLLFLNVAIAIYGNKKDRHDLTV